MPFITFEGTEARLESARLTSSAGGTASISGSVDTHELTDLGFDLSLHSGTKYLNGHSDIVCGAVIGQADLVARVKKMMNYLGGSLDAHACFLLHRGLKTLAVRVRQQGGSALALARTLEALAREGSVALYRGIVAEALVSEMEKTGGDNGQYDLTRMTFSPDNYWIKVTADNGSTLYQSRITRFADIPDTGKPIGVTQFLLMGAVTRWQGEH